ncbi:Sorting nexin mvp1 [Blastocladiella emersonii ATCC 22665]|nr:Sorting nexin mvp1 [Blastocladiella emersonii ATCC 22665]
MSDTNLAAAPANGSPRSSVSASDANGSTADMFAAASASSMAAAVNVNPGHNPWSSQIEDDPEPPRTSAKGKQSPMEASVVFPSRPLAFQIGLPPSPELPATRAFARDHHLGSGSGAGSALGSSANLMPTSPDSSLMDDPWQTVPSAKSHHHISSSSSSRPAAAAAILPVDEWTSHASVPAASSSTGQISPSSMVAPICDPHFPPEPAPSIMSDATLVNRPAQSHTTPAAAAAPPQPRQPQPDSHLQRSVPSSSSGAAEDSTIGADDDLSWLATVESVTVTIAPEKGGSIFKHVNYFVSQSTSDTTVTRRYSDFLWLHEYLGKKYPFRLVLTLPPKKVNADQTFLERRRRALQRYLTHLVRHPVLAVDPVVRAFFTRPDELAVYRKTHTVDTTPEAPRPNGGERLIPQVQDYLNHLEAQLEPTFARYQRIVDRIEAICQRELDMAADLESIAATVHEIGNQRPHCFSNGCTSCVRIADGSAHVASHMEALAAAHSSFAKSASLGSVEAIKALRDQAAALELLLQRAVKSAIAHQAQCVALARRIATTQDRLDTGAPAFRSAADRDRAQAQVDADRAARDAAEQAIWFTYRCLAEELRAWHRQGTWYALALHQVAGEQNGLAGALRAVAQAMVAAPLIPDAALRQHQQVAAAAAAAGAASAASAASAAASAAAAAGSRKGSTASLLRGG